VADSFNETIRQVTSSGVVSTIVGQAGVSGTNDGTGNVARFNYPEAITVNSSGTYVADNLNNTIRKITSRTRIIPPGNFVTTWTATTIAGQAGVSGNADGTGINAQFNSPAGIAVDNSGNLYVADEDNSTIRKITPVGTNWVVTTIVGSNAQFQSPVGIAVDGAGTLYVADEGNSTISKITPVGNDWVVSTIGGLVGSYGSKDGAGSAAQFDGPFGITVDNSGTVYVADTGNNTIRKGTFTAFSPANPTSTVQPATGVLTVTLVPAGAGGQWRFGWEENWRNSGTSAGNLVGGNYPVEFRSVPGWLVIQTTTNFTVAVTNGGTTYLTNQYYPTIGTVDTNSGGSLTVNLATSPAQPPPGAGWQFLGDANYYPSGYSTNLVAGTYLIGFAPVAGFSKPPNLAVTVSAGLPTVLTESYPVAADAPQNVLLPFPVPTNEISDLADYPFGFNGQLQSDVGYGSGVAVSAKVVLTAAHIVFNDETLSYVSQTYWYFQEETNESATAPPQVAQGWLVLSGYASQRTNDLEGVGGQTYGPDESSPQSRNFDVAALYFTSPVAGGGYGGYLPSDDSPNPWLNGNSLKMVVGYPVDGSLFGASIMPGVMYQTDPQPYALNPDIEPEVYTAPWVLSYPGNSGGPVYVQFNGYYYPAGVYLGIINNGSYESAVRAIDSDVVNLITNAEALADYGSNHTGGGVITIIPNQAVSASNPGYLQFLLGPPAAVLAGAGWQLQGDTSFSSATNYIRAVLSTNSFTVLFKQINGWNVPVSQPVSVEPGHITTITNALYTVNSPVLVANHLGIGITGTTGTVYQIERSSSLTSGTWLPVSTNTITTTSFNLVLPYTTTNSPAAFYRALWLP
jgi:DNA-binding beta-propeller fold protein YncE